MVIIQRSRFTSYYAIVGMRLHLMSGQNSAVHGIRLWTALSGIQTYEDPPASGSPRKIPLIMETTGFIIRARDKPEASMR